MANQNVGDVKFLQDLSDEKLADEHERLKGIRAAKYDAQGELELLERVEHEMKRFEGKKAESNKLKWPEIWSEVKKRYDNRVSRLKDCKLAIEAYGPVQDKYLKEILQELERRKKIKEEHDKRMKEEYEKQRIMKEKREKEEKERLELEEKNRIEQEKNRIAQEEKEKELEEFNDYVLECIDYLRKHDQETKYLDDEEIVEKAHRYRFDELHETKKCNCGVDINYEYYNEWGNSGYYANTFKIAACNGRNDQGAYVGDEYNDPNEDEEYSDIPCCHKRYTYIVNLDFTLYGKGFRYDDDKCPSFYGCIY